MATATVSGSAGAWRATRLGARVHVDTNVPGGAGRPTPSGRGSGANGAGLAVMVAMVVEDAQRLQQDIRKTEAEQRRQRQDIFAVEDEIEAWRDALIASLQKRRNQSLFVLRWAAV